MLPLHDEHHQRYSSLARFRNQRVGFTAVPIQIKPTGGSRKYQVTLASVYGSGFEVDHINLFISAAQIEQADLTLFQPVKASGVVSAYQRHTRTVLHNHSYAYYTTTFYFKDIRNWRRLTRLPEDGLSIFQHQRYKALRNHLLRIQAQRLYQQLIALPNDGQREQLICKYQTQYFGGNNK